MMSQDNINKRVACKRITYSELIKFKGFEDYTELEANEVIETLYQMSILCFQLHKNKTGTYIEL
jgi:hypothetical protein